MCHRLDNFYWVDFHCLQNVNVLEYVENDHTLLFEE
jgi:hypothetical protein